jgi:16S rRNA processing protein RimM
MKRVPDHLLVEGDLRLGYISGVFGTRGEVRLMIYNLASAFLDKKRTVTLVSLDGARRDLPLKARPGAGRRVLARVGDAQDKPGAEALVGLEIVVHRDRLPLAEPGVWYHHDLLDVPVVDTEGRELGTLVEIHSAGEVDIWLIRGPEGECFLPALQDNIVDVEPGTRITVRAAASMSLGDV